MCTLASDQSGSAFVYFVDNDLDGRLFVTRFRIRLKAACPLLCSMAYFFGSDP